MSIPRSLVIAAIAACSTVAALPASAGAACATVPFPDLVRVADVVATVEFLPGDADASGTLRTPARARVIRLDQGYASKELQVSTALGAIAFGIEGIRPKAGEVWRLYGTRAPNGSIGTSICSGSVVMPAEPASASITIGGKRRSLVPSSIEGRQRKGRLPVRPDSAARQSGRQGDQPGAGRRCIAGRRGQGRHARADQGDHANTARQVVRAFELAARTTAEVQAQDRQAGLDARDRHPRGVVRDRAAATSLSLAARGSALMRASSRIAAPRSGIGHDAASFTGRRLRV